MQSTNEQSRLRGGKWLGNGSCLDMAHAGSFRVPTSVAQDLALIMEFVDPPELQSASEASIAKFGSDGGRNGKVKVEVESDDDIASSGTESEDEVEAEIAAGLGSDGNGVLRGPSSATQLEESDSSTSDSDSSSSVSSSLHLHSVKLSSKPPPVIDIDLDEDGPAPPDTYVPSAHELSPTAIPVPPWPDPSTLPLDPLERIGEIATVLPDTVIVRGGSGSGTGHLNARERRDAALDEGSLLLFEDRTLLGHVSETFGPTALPHYVVRINRRRDGAEEIISNSHSALNKNANSETTGEGQSVQSSSSRPDRPDPAKLLVSQAVYHIPSLSTFVFPGALARLKGSDASNFHDEEPADHEIEFSDDEAEAAFKRLRKNSTSRASSRAPSVAPYREDDSVSMSTMGEDAGSLYGASPYDFEDSAVTYGGEDTPVSAMDVPGSSSPSTMFVDPAVRDALMHARNSRTRRSSSVSADMSPIAGPSRPSYDASKDGRGRERGRGRGNDRHRGDRGRGRNRGRGRGQSNTPRMDRTSPPQTQAHAQAPPFSFEEYDPHMPRPPSPTSVAIARVTGQWADGTPFPHQYGSGGAVSSVTRSTQLPVQPHEHSRMSYETHEQFDRPAFNYSQAQQQVQTAQYGVAPHINPRFAQAFGFPGTEQVPSARQSVYDILNINIQPGTSESLEHDSDRPMAAE